MSFELNYKASSLAKNIDLVKSQKLGALILMYASTKASEIEADMKTNRPWTDRTGDAKKFLTAKVTNPKEVLIRIILAHGVDYGIWLELANEKNYAIISPTIDKQGPLLMKGLSGMMKKLKI